jgi:phosphoribosylformylglycinamidine synthase
MSVFGKIPDATKTMTADFKKENSVICLVGKLDLVGMAGSVYFDTQKILGTELPKVDLRLLTKIANVIYKLLKLKKILSIHDVSEGGLITAIFEMCVGGNMGANLNLSKIKNDRIDYVLFNETAGSFIAEIESEKIARQIFENIPFVIIGKTQKQKTIDVQNGKPLFSANLEALKKSWQKPMRRMFP